MTRPHVSTAFDALHAHRKTLETRPLRTLFAEDPQRFASMHVEAAGVLFDYSKHRATGETMRLLVDLARAADLEQRRTALFDGAPINATEHRPALHMALRHLGSAPFLAEGKDVMPDVRDVRAKMLAFADGIRDGTIKAGGKRFTDVVNIGIGGSDLGPAMAARALATFVPKGLTLHFVSNVDGADLGDVLKEVTLETTLFIVCSKTFTTLETMTNAQSARKAVVAALGEAAVKERFCAVSTQLDKIAEFGIAEDRVFGFWDWVGGRYSIWSSIGLSVAIGVGSQNFTDFLAGGELVDKHFVEAPLEKNIPVLMGLFAVWYHDVWGFGAQAVIPYDQRLGRFAAYLQQLEMESNGKSVTLDGHPAGMQTGPIIFGEPGTNGQHAFFQLFHQGTEIVPIDFLIAATPLDADAHHHDLLLANCLAQSEAMMKGRTLEEAEALLRKQGLSATAIAALGPHKVFAGNRPSSTFLYKQMSPKILGTLIALYEHAVFTQAMIWNTNPFDQWGVELGKELASRLVPIVADAGKSLDELDASTAGLIAARRKLAG